ncbi:MAG TPA: hypothetical protein EYN06_07225 [Myxococcales bacterium]|nr:hypothetical protein [Myxococcales bacterium]
MFHESSGGNAFWSDTYDAVPINNGVFSVLLGAGNNLLEASKIDGSIKYLEISIAGGVPLEPRLQVVSVPYAIRADIAGTSIYAEEAGKLGGLAASDFAKAADVVGLSPMVQVLQDKVAYLEGQISTLVNCNNECDFKGSVGCSEDLSQTYTCGESGDEDPCFEKLYQVCPGSLKCVAGTCDCALAYTVECMGDTPYEMDSCGNKGKMLSKCAEGLCSNGACVKWKRETPLKTSGINDMITVNGDLYAVGNGGLVLHYDGKYWTTMNSGTTKHLNAIWGRNSNGDTLLYAVGQSGKVIRYQNGKWTTELTASYTTLNGVFGLDDSNDVWAVGNGGKVLKRKQKDIWESVDLGDEFTTHFHTVWAHSSTLLWIGGEGGQIIKRDGDESTQQVTQEGTGTVRHIFGINKGDIYAAADGRVLKKDNDNWTGTLDNGINFTRIFIDADNLITVVGNGGNVFQKDLLGANWTQETKVADALGGSVNFQGVSGGPSAPMGDMWIIAQDGTVAHLDPETSWKFPTVSRTVKGIWGNTQSEQWAVGTSCLALRRQNGEWLEAKIEGSQCAGGNGSVHFNAIWADASGNTKYAVGNDGMFKFWNDDDNSWVDHPGPNGNSHQDIWGMDEDNLFVVQKGATYYFNNNAGWQNTGGGGGVSGFGTATSNFYTVDGSSGTVRHFDLSEWSEQSVTTKALADIWGTSANDIWVVGNDGAVFNFNGISWDEETIPEELLPSGAGANLNAVFTKTAGGPVYIAADGGHSFIYGNSWSHEQTTPANSHESVFGVGVGNNIEVVLGGVGTIYRRDNK